MKDTEAPGQRTPVSAVSDPLRALQTARFAELEANPFPAEFASGEHLWLGNLGVDIAFRQVDDLTLKYDALDFSALYRRAEGVMADTFSYGELVALSGDFYATPDALFDETSSTVHLPFFRNDIGNLRELFDEELEAIDAQRRGRDVAYPDRALATAWSARSYVELALKNVDHFGWHCIKLYCAYHQRALELAATCRGADLRDARLRKAVFYNAFADHFLTDSFAAGHMRVPRQQIIDHFDHEKLAGALSKVLHDQDGHLPDRYHSHGEIVGEDDGLRVINSRGEGMRDVWRTRCDGQLFITRVRTDADKKTLAPGRQHPHVRLPAQAVAASLEELIRAHQTGKVPTGTFDATMYVPFPHPEEPSLIEKFSADMPSDRFEQIYDSVGWYSKIPWLVGVSRKQVRALFAELPVLMAKFRAAVAADIAAAPQLTERLPEAYLAAMQDLR